MFTHDVIIICNENIIIFNKMDTKLIFLGCFVCLIRLYISSNCNMGTKLHLGHLILIEVNGIFIIIEFLSYYNTSSNLINLKKYCSIHLGILLIHIFLNFSSIKYIYLYNQYNIDIYIYMKFTIDLLFINKYHMMVIIKYFPGNLFHNLLVILIILVK